VFSVPQSSLCCAFKPPGKSVNIDDADHLPLKFDVKTVSLAG
jgi:hypothetical protein